MKTSERFAALCVAAVLVCTSASAQISSLGFFNSPKGFGITAHFTSNENVFYSATAFADLYGVTLGRTNVPGVKCTVGRNRIFSRKEKEWGSLALYFGPGISVGFVHDFENGISYGFHNVLRETMGTVVALNGTFGAQFDFGRRLFVDVSFTAEAGLHTRQDIVHGNTLLSAYLNGLLQCFYPQVGLQYRF